MLRELRVDAHALASLALAILLVHASLLRSTTYAYTDDYSFLSSAQESLPQLTRGIIGGGRPVAAAVDAVAFSFVDSVAGMRWLRVISVVGLVLLACLLFKVLERAGMNRVLAWSSALIVVSLPCFQAVTAWSILFFVPFVAAVAGGAALVTEREAATHRGRVLLWRLCLPALVILLCLSAYQPAAMWYWVFAAITPLCRRSTSQHLVRLGMLHLLVVGSASLLSLGVLKLGVAYAGTTGSRSELASSPFEKLAWFVQEPLRRAFDPLGVPSTDSNVGRSIALGVLVAGLAYFQARRLGQARVRIAVLASLVLLSVLPNLVVAENWASARTLIALMPLTALLACWGVVGTFQTLGDLRPGAQRPARVAATGVLAVVAAAAALQAQHVLMTYYVVPQERESDLIARAIQEVAADVEPQVIYVRRSSWQNSLAPSSSYDEFGTPSSFPSFSVIPLMEQLVRERGIPYSGSFVLLPDGDNAIGPPVETVIDLGRLLESAR